MTRRNGIHTAVLALGLLAAGWAFASRGEHPEFPPAIGEAIASGATVVFLDAEGNAIWSSALGLEPRSDLLARAVQVVIYDAEGNPILTLDVTMGPDGEAMISTPSGITLEAERLAEAALGREDHPEDHEGEEERGSSRNEGKEHGSMETPDHDDRDRGDADEHKGADRDEETDHDEDDSDHDRERPTHEQDE